MDLIVHAHVDLYVQSNRYYLAILIRLIILAFYQKKKYYKNEEVSFAKRLNIYYYLKCKISNGLYGHIP